MHGVSLASIFLRAFETWCSAFVLMLALVLAMDKCTVTAILYLCPHLIMHLAVIFDGG